MIYEQRVYRAMPGRLPKLLAWEAVAEREVKWNAFQADPEWKPKRTDSEKDGPLVANIMNSLLSPTAFSLLK